MLTFPRQGDACGVLALCWADSGCAACVESLWKA